MKRIFTILFALVLVLSLSLVTAVPVVATAWDVTYTTQGSGTSSGLSNDQAKFGNYSAKLALPANFTNGEFAHVTVEMPAGMVLNNFTSGSYWYYPDGGTMSMSAVGVKEGTAGDAHPTGYMTFYLDTNDDATADVWVVQWESHTTGTGWQKDTITNSARKFHVEGYSESSYNQGETPGTLAEVKDDTPPPGSGLTELGEATLLSVRVETGGWTASDSYTTNPLVTYIDDITINGQTCKIEPSGSVGLTADVPDITAISVTPTGIDYGILEPGDTSSAYDITITNIGTRTVNVDAYVLPSSTVFDYLEIYYDSGWHAVPTTGMVTGLVMDTSTNRSTILRVPSNYIASGPESATLICEAIASP